MRASKTTVENLPRKYGRLRHPEKAKNAPNAILKKPAWIRVKAPKTKEYLKTRNLIRDQKLNTVCEEAACPNIGQCWSQGHATVMILGSVCTRACAFCNVATGKPDAVNPLEPENLAISVAETSMNHVVITSVDRDDLVDGGARQFAKCILRIRERAPDTTIEVLTPDFRDKAGALGTIIKAGPDVFNHNLETVPRLYKKVRPGADYVWSLELLRQFKARNPDVPTKSGLMLGLGEDSDEVVAVMKDMRAHDVDMLTLGQYLQPSRDHLKVERFVQPDEFSELGEIAASFGFSQVASAPLVRSSYHADLQAKGEF